MVVVIIFGPLLSGWCASGRGRTGMNGRAGGGSVWLVSRIFYVVISVAELFTVGVGYILRNTVTYLSFAVSLDKSLSVALLRSSLKKTFRHTTHVLYIAIGVGSSGHEGHVPPDF